jgi:hypothetical protein
LLHTRTHKAAIPNTKDHALPGKQPLSLFSTIRQPERVKYTAIYSVNACNHCAFRD